MQRYYLLFALEDRDREVIAINAEVWSLVF